MSGPYRVMEEVATPRCHVDGDVGTHYFRMSELVCECRKHAVSRPIAWLRLDPEPDEKNRVTYSL